MRMCRQPCPHCCSQFAAKHFAGGLRRNWQYIPPNAFLMCWAVTVAILWILVLAGEDSKVNKAKLLWAAIPTSVLGAPLLAGSFYWSHVSLKRYDASMAYGRLEGGVASAEPLQRGDGMDSEAHSPLLLNASPPGRAEESC